MRSAHQHHLALAVLGLLPALEQQPDLFITADQGGQAGAAAGVEAALDIAGAGHVKYMDRRGHAFQGLRAEVFQLASPASCFLCRPCFSFRPPSVPLYQEEDTGALPMDYTHRCPAHQSEALELWSFSPKLGGLSTINGKIVLQYYHAAVGNTDTHRQAQFQL